MGCLAVAFPARLLSQVDQHLYDQAHGQTVKKKPPKYAQD